MSGHTRLSGIANSLTGSQIAPHPLRVPQGADPWVNMPTCAKPQIVDSSPPDCHLSRCCASEIGDALSAFEQQRQQNSTILQQLTERDAALATLRAEKLALQQQLESASETVRTAG